MPDAAACTPEPISPATRPSAVGAAFLFLAALALRGAFTATQLPSLLPDPDNYRELAISLRTTGVFAMKPAAATATPRPTAYRPPLYPLLLTPLVHQGDLASWKIAVLHSLLGAATVVITLVVGYQAGLGAWSYLAAGLTAFDPILLNQSTVVMTETLATFLAVAAWSALAHFGRRPSLTSAVASGALLGLATLCRPTFFFWLVFVAAGLFVVLDIARRGRYAMVLAIAAAAVLAPWTVRNAVHFGRPIFATTHGGYTLWLANNDLHYDHLLRGEHGVFDAERLFPRLRQIPRTQREDEIAFDRLLYEEAKQTIARRPAAFAYATLHRMATLWRLTPRQVGDSESTVETLARLAVGVWYGGVLTLAAAGAASLRGRLLRSPWTWGLLLCLAFTGVHAIYWTDMRMRAPLMPAVTLAAAAGAAWFVPRKPHLIEPAAANYD